MDVSEFYDTEGVVSVLNAESITTVTGWLVLIGVGLYFLEREYSGDYKAAKKIKIINSEITYAIRDCILPLGGGESFLFHRAEGLGVVVGQCPLSFEIQELRVEEIGGGWVTVDISQKNILASKLRYEKLLSPAKSSSGDWLDEYI